MARVVGADSSAAISIPIASAHALATARPRPLRPPGTGLVLEVDPDTGERVELLRTVTN